MDYPSVRGFVNPEDSCFINATLVSMFGPFIVHRDVRANRESSRNFEFEGQNFWNIMIAQDIDERLAHLMSLGIEHRNVCNDDPVKDLQIRTKIQELLRIEVRKLMTGEIGECSLLRKILGKVCGEDDRKYRIRHNLRLRYDNMDLSFGHRPAVDLYERLTRVFEYDPIISHFQKTYFYQREPVHENIQSEYHEMVKGPNHSIDIPNLIEIYGEDNVDSFLQCIF